MTRSFRASILAGVAAIGLGLMPALAAADDDRGRRGHGQGRGEYQWSRGHDYDRGHYRGDGRKHGHHKSYRHGHKYGHGHKHKARKHGHRHEAKRRGHDDDLLPFLVIGAVGLTAAILANQAHAAAPSPQTAAYVPPPAPAPQPASGYTWAPAPQASSTSCLMTREYQTKVTVGGRLVDAYGQACLQPDGAWLKGPAQPVPY